MNLRASLIAAGFSALLLQGCTSYGGLADNSSAVSRQAALPAPDPARPDAQREAFRVGPFDKLSVNVFGVEALSREVTIDSSGSFSLPLIGQVSAAGRTTDELSALIGDKLRGRYVRDPQVSVGIVEVRSQRFTVDGAVVQPGLFPLVGRMSLSQAVATARGPSEFAAINKVAVFRTVNNQRMAALFDLRGIREGRYEDPQIYGDDIIVVGENGFRRFFRDVIPTFSAFGVFTPVL